MPSDPESQGPKPDVPHQYSSLASGGWGRAGAAGRWGESRRSGRGSGEGALVSELWVEVPGYGVGDWGPGSGPRVRGRVSGSGIEARGTRLKPRPAPCSSRRAAAPHRPWLVRERQAWGTQTGQDLPAASTEPTPAGERTGGRWALPGSHLFPAAGRSRERMGWSRGRWCYRGDRAGLSGCCRVSVSQWAGRPLGAGAGTDAGGGLGRWAHLWAFPKSKRNRGKVKGRWPAIFRQRPAPVNLPAPGPL